VSSPTNRKKIKFNSSFIDINMLENQRFDEENLIVGDNTNNGKVHANKNTKLSIQGNLI
jgi:hypothetical protein